MEFQKKKHMKIKGEKEGERRGGGGRRVRERPRDGGCKNERSSALCPLRRERSFPERESTQPSTCDSLWANPCLTPKQSPRPSHQMLLRRHSKGDSRTGLFGLCEPLQSLALHYWHASHHASLSLMFAAGGAVNGQTCVGVEAGWGWGWGWRVSRSGSGHPLALTLQQQPTWHLTAMQWPAFDACLYCTGFVLYFAT